LKERLTMSGKLDDRIALLERWVRNFTTHPHPELGRDGVVCPYMVKALRKDLVKVRALDARDGDAALAGAGRSMLAELQELGPAYGSDRIYLVRFTVPYGLPDPELRAMVERVHLKLKPEYVSQGYMVGDFWPDHEMFEGRLSDHWAGRLDRAEEEARLAL